MEISPYLNFDGRCAAAFTFYEQVFDARIEMMQTHGESPIKDHVPRDWRDKILRARLSIDGKVLMGSDAPPSNYSAPQGFYVSVAIPRCDGERIFSQLSENGKVHMPFQKTFWAAGFGMAVDRYGIPWMINCEA